MIEYRRIKINNVPLTPPEAYDKNSLAHTYKQIPCPTLITTGSIWQQYAPEINQDSMAEYNIYIILTPKGTL